MEKNRNEINKMDTEEYKAYLETLTPQERKEEEDITESDRAAYQAELDRIAASGERKFDHEKIKKMSLEERVKFLDGLSPEDLDLFFKESSVETDKLIKDTKESLAKRLSP
jgi:hypothetical protein